MTDQTSNPYRRTLSGSVGAGMGSLFRPGSRKYYILEHKVSSKYHRAGESQEIIVDNIELGRDARCQVRFDESFKTVSRRHAAIVRDGDGWKLVQLSQTNTTLLNGRPVKTEWYLQSGDEIQLSVNGPKLGFIVPTGRKATVGSIGLTRRLSLFRQQALRPYKTAIAALAAVLLICAGAGGFVIFRQHRQIQDNSKLLAEARAANEKNAKLIAEQRKIIGNQGGLLDSLQKRIPAEATMPVTPPYPGGQAPAGAQPGQAPAQQPPAAGGGAAEAPGMDFTAYHPHIYFIQAQVVSLENGERITGWVGTGFLLSDGKFVSARHVLTPFYSNSYRFIDGELNIINGADPMDVYREMQGNILYVQGRAKIVFKCTSVSDSFTFSTTYQDSPVASDGSHDEIATLPGDYVVLNQNKEVLAQIPAGTQLVCGTLDYTDYAFVQTDFSGGLEADRELSVNLKQGTQLSIVGYPHGWGQGNPILSTALCSQNGLSPELGNTIMVSNNNTEGGNSGGPVFAQKDGRWVVVAIVSGLLAQKGSFVPIAVIP